MGYTNDDIVYRNVDFLQDLEWLIESQHEMAELSYPEYRRTFYTEKVAIQRIRSFVRREDVVILIATIDSKAVGYFSFLIQDDKFLDMTRAYIADLYVLPEFRSKGIGTSMKLYIEKLAQEIGLDSISSTVTVTNEPIMDLNKKLGYQVKRVFWEKKL